MSNWGRDGEPYVTFLDGLSRQNAEREARVLFTTADQNRSPSFGGRAGSGCKGEDGDLGSFEPACHSDEELRKVKGEPRRQACGF